MQNDDTFTCVKCGKSYEDGREPDGSNALAAWDGNGGNACWDCFRTYGWKAFGKDFSPYAPR